MPVTTDTLYNIRKLNVWFGISALLGLVSLGWMLWHDYDRPWRHTQRAYFNLRSAMAHFKALSYENEDAKRKHEALRAAVARAQAKLETPETKRRLDELERERLELEGRLQGAALTFGNMNAELGVTVFKYEEAKALHGSDDPRTRAILAKYEADTRALAAQKLKKDRIEDALREKKAEVRRLYAERTEAQRALDAYEKGLKDALDLDRLFGPGPVRYTINLPILDSFAPKGIPGREEVKQVFLPDIRFDYNFIDSYVTDRCITCHVSIDDPKFTKAHFVALAEQALKTERVSRVLTQANERLIRKLSRRLADVEVEPGMASDAFVNAFVAAANDFLDAVGRPRIDATRIRDRFKSFPPDRGRVQSEIEAAIRPILAAAPPRPSGAPDARPLTYRQMTRKQKRDYFQSLSAAMNLYLEDQGRPAVAFERVFTAHPDLDLFVSVDSPHPMKTMGCTVCHEGSGQDTDFVLAAHTPKTEEEEREWERKYYVREAGLPLATFHLVEEYWEHPMFQPEYVSASCARCHDQIFDLERFRTEKLKPAENIVKGHDLFTRLGCIDCHNVDGLSGSRRVGPDLQRVGYKLSRGFTERWIDYPSAFRPSTRMPHFFHQENNLPSSANQFDPDPVLRTQTEVQAIAEYLLTFTKPFEPLPVPAGLTGDPKRGEELLTSVGCLACHAVLDAHDPLDQQNRSFGERWIIRDIAVEKARAEARRLGIENAPGGAEQKQQLLDKAMAEARATFASMTKNERVRYASRRFTRARRDRSMEAAQAERARADSREEDPDPLKTYVPPEFARQGPELGGVGTKLVNDPNDPEQVARGREWLYNWLRDPRHYAPNTIMPRLFRDRYYQDDPPETQRRKNDQDILDITAYLLSLRTPDFDPTPFDETPAHRKERQRLILMLLGGQNTVSVSEKILNDEKMDPSEPYGALTRAIIAQTYRSFGDGEAGRRKVLSLIEDRCRGLSKEEALFERQKLFFGMKMISHYGCFACHNIAGFEDVTRPGTDLTLWGQKFMSQLDFAFFSTVFEEERKAKREVFEGLYRASTPEDLREFGHLIRDIAETSADILAHLGGRLSPAGNIPQHILHNHGAFAYHKLRNPRIWDREKYKKPYEKLKMPNFFLTDGEARALTTFLLSRREPNVVDEVKITYEDTPEGRIARGRDLARRLNCIGCHTIEGNSEATIHQYYSDDPALGDDFAFGERFKPPLLWGEGAKIQYDWLFRFLNNVEMLRPWLKVRMPSFYLTTEEATTLVEYFAGLSENSATLLKGQLDPIARYLQQVHSGDASASRHWFTEKRFADQADFLRRYAVRQRQIRLNQFDTSDAADQAEAAETLADAYDTVLARTGFLADLFDVPFPFPDNRTHAIDDKEFERGEAFFYDLKCLACHVAGDPSVPGTTTQIKAPNFALAHERLRYDWIIKWLQDPQAIQPGANMPQIFQGGSAYASLPEETRREKEAKFGETVEEQSRLLVDFLFALGRRRYTAIQPGAVEQAEQAGEEGGEMEFDFDEDASSSEQKDEPEFDFDDEEDSKADVKTPETEASEPPEPEFDFEDDG